MLQAWWIKQRSRLKLSIWSGGGTSEEEGGRRGGGCGGGVERGGRDQVSCNLIYPSHFIHQGNSFQVSMCIAACAGGSAFVAVDAEFFMQIREGWDFNDLIAFLTVVMFLLQLGFRIVIFTTEIQHFSWFNV